MLFILKHFTSSIKTAITLSKDKKFSLFLKIFNTRFFYAFPAIREFFSPKTKLLKNIKKSFFFKNKISSAKLFNDLSELGYNNELFIKKNILNKIKNEITLKNSIIDFKSNQKKKLDYFKSLKPNASLKSILLRSKKKKIAHVALDIDLKKTKFIKKLITSELITNIAKQYLGSKEVHMFGKCYISNPVKTTVLKKKDNAQYFHYDNDFKKFFRIFIYLTDVTKEAGPHSFVATTHKYKKISHILAERIDDREIKKTYSPEKIKVFCGEKGQVILEDTFGLHKGVVPTKISRIMLILYFGLDSGFDMYRYPLVKKLS